MDLKKIKSDYDKECTQEKINKNQLQRHNKNIENIEVNINTLQS